MCGIVGYTGIKNAREVVLYGLELLEYRGYDSAGYVTNDGELHIVKDKGRVSALAKLPYPNISETSVSTTDMQTCETQNLARISADSKSQSPPKNNMQVAEITEFKNPHSQQFSCDSCLAKQSPKFIENIVPNVAIASDPPHTAIGHTRWATHGEPSARNAHPHLSFDKRVAICHNGIIENYLELKEELKTFGINFASDTDSELIAHFIALNLKSDLKKAVEATVARLKGSFTILATSVVNPTEIVAYRKRASLIIGLGENENLVASDILALSAYTSRAIILRDEQLAVISPLKVKVYFNGKEIPQTISKLDTQHFEPMDCHMQSEILEIPCALKRTYHSFCTTNLDNLFSNNKYNRVVLVGCGTAYHAALFGKYCFEEIAELPTEAVIASEFYGCKFLNEHTLAVFISQSGETADTLLAQKRAKDKGATTLALTNVKGSSLSYESDFTLLLNCGAEIAVAATKSFNSQLLALYLIAHKLVGKIAKEDEIYNLINECNLLCQRPSPFRLESEQKFFFIGRGLDFITAREGALKFKEITYNMTDAQPAGELKHGTIALIDKQSLVVAVLTEEREKNKMQTSLNELKSRGANTIVLTNLDCEGDITIKLPKHNDKLLSVISAVIPLQQLALSTSKAFGLDPDKPRNLAKSVTVD